MVTDEGDGMKMIRWEIQTIDQLHVQSGVRGKGWDGMGWYGPKTIDQIHVPFGEV